MFAMGVMDTEAQRLRRRASQCRELAKIARDGHSRKTLAQLAEELDEEADKIDAEEAARPKMLRPI
jgi:hypothetical protein